MVPQKNLLPLNKTLLKCSYYLSPETFDVNLFFRRGHDVFVVGVAANFAAGNTERKAIFLDFCTFLALVAILAWEWS